MRVALCVLFSLTLTAQNRTLDEAAAFDKQAAEKVRSQTPLAPLAVQDYIARLGAKLTHLTGSSRPYRFSAFAPATIYIDLPPEHNPLHEPVVLVDGDIFVPPTLFLAVQDESEFAGVLAQAIARGPLLDDWIKRNPAYPSTAYNAWVAAQCLHCVMPPAVLAERRKIELQADKSAVLVMSRGGFDPTALLRYLERVQPPDAKAGANSHFYDQTVSTFPARADRIAGLQKALRGLPAASGPESEEFRAIQEQVRASIPEVPKPSGPTLSKPVRGALAPANTSGAPISVTPLAKILFSNLLNHFAHNLAYAANVLPLCSKCKYVARPSGSL
jgi:hypothetical protein